MTEYPLDIQPECLMNRSRKMNEHTNPTKRLTRVLRKRRAKACGSDPEFYAAFEQAIAKTKEDIDTLYVSRDEVEREYMKLPVDADGVPIRQGDRLEHVHGGWRFDADTLEIGGFGAYVRPNGQARVLACNCRHVQPDSIEGLLEEFAAKMCHLADEQRTSEGYAVIDKYAEKIRGLR